MRDSYDLYSLYKECMEMCEDVGVSYDRYANISFRKIGSGALGQCTSSHEIYINDSFRDERITNDVVKDTILHEMCHTVFGCFNHGPAWKEQAERLNRRFGTNISRVSTLDAKTREILVHVAAPRYIIKCTSCGRMFGRERMSNVVKHPENYLCMCGGNLVLEK